MKITRRLLACLSIALCGALHAKQVPFFENPYLVQAPATISEVVDQIAQELKFTQDYQIAVPKKAGLHLNPWNKFIQGGVINPESRCICITVGPEWFLSLPTEQQTYWIARSFVNAQMGVVLISQGVMYVYVGITFIILLLLYWMLSKALCNNRPRWVRCIISLVCVLIVDHAVGDKIVAVGTTYATHYYGMSRIKKTIEKTGNPLAAVQALRAMDSALNNELQDGETLFAPYKDTYKEFAKSVELEYKITNQN